MVPSSLLVHFKDLLEVVWEARAQGGPRSTSSFTTRFSCTTTTTTKQRKVQEVGVTADAKVPNGL